MKEAQPFRGGMPYGPDVDRLKEAFSELPEGLLISADELSKVIRAPVRSQRYYGVIHSWIKQMLGTRDVFLAWVKGEGVKVLDPAERMRHAVENEIKPGMRKSGRGSKHFHSVDRDRLDDQGKRAFDHQSRVLQVLDEARRTASRSLPYDVPAIRSLPKPRRVG